MPATAPTAGRPTSGPLASSWSSSCPKSAVLARPPGPLRPARGWTTRERHLSIRRAFADVEPTPPSSTPPPPPPPPPSSRPPSNISPDAVLMAPGSVPVYVYGTEHAAADPGVGAAILGAGPHAVVVETSLSPAHGAARGAAISGLAPWPPPDAPEATRAAAAADPDAEAVVEQARGLAAQLAARLPPLAALSSAPSPSGPAPMDWSPFGPGASALWDALAGHFAGEQLASIAALASGARLVHGDRPKRLTLARLARAGSLASLDAAVGAANAANYASIAAGGADAPEPPPPGEQAASAFGVLLLERDACLCATLAAEAAASAAHAAATATPPRPVVAVVGAWHVAGMRHLWADGGWKATVAAAEAEPPSEKAWGEAEAARSGGRLSPGAALGTGRALVDALLRFTSTADGGVGEVDAAAAACPGGAEGAAAAAAVGEVWGSTRALLAALPSDLLPRIASGWRCELDSEGGPLGPLRAVRPVNGGLGATPQVVDTLRGLHFFFWQ